MASDNILVWNVRGLNSRGHRNVVRTLVEAKRISLLCLQETKMVVIDNHTTLPMLGSDFDFCYLLADGVKGGILLAWRTDSWSVRNISRGTYCLTAQLLKPGSDAKWWITCVYVPQDEQEKIAFLQELSPVRQQYIGPWLLCGHFNIIYKAEDKNNSLLNRRMMGRFRSFISRFELQDLNLHGRTYTWLNEQCSPMLERLDRVLATSDWVLEPIYRLLGPCAIASANRRVGELSEKIPI